MPPPKERFHALGPNLRALRESRDMTLDEAAAQFDTFRPVVWRWENKQAEPSLTLLCRLADFYGVSTDALLGRKPLPKVKRRPA